VNAQPSLSDLTGDARALYRRILRSLPAPVEELAHDLGWPVSRTQDNLAVLLDLDLVLLDGDGRPRADDPRASIGRLIDRSETELDAWRHQLLGLREDLSGYEVDYRTGLQLSGPRQPMFEEVTPAHAPEVVQMLARTSTGPIRQVSSQIDVGPGHDDSVRRHRQEGLATGREHRAIFGVDVLTDPRWLPYAESRAAAGERQRYLEDITVQFAVFGTAGVVVGQGPQPHSDFLLIRSPVIVAVFDDFFEELWRRAEPVQEADASAQTKRMLELLSLGFKDEAIARQMGLGLRTVRRRVADLMEDHGVDTRFQLGLALGRRGLLD
jgi:hypothetical protein